MASSHSTATRGSSYCVTTATATTRPTSSLSVAGFTAPARGQFFTVLSRLPEISRSPVGVCASAVTASVWLLPRPLSSGSSAPRAWVVSSLPSVPAEKKRSSSGSNRIAVTAPS